MVDIHGNNKTMSSIQHEQESKMRHSNEYHTVMMLLQQYKDATSLLDRIETTSTIYSWVIRYPHVLLEDADFSNDLRANILTLHTNVIHNIGLGLERAKSNKMEYDELLMFGAYHKLMAYLQLIRYTLKIDA
jgi:hypothetical protein